MGRYFVPEYCSSLPVCWDECTVVIKWPLKSWRLKARNANSLLAHTDSWILAWNCFFVNNWQQHSFLGVLLALLAAAKKSPEPWHWHHCVSQMRIQDFPPQHMCVSQKQKVVLVLGSNLLHQAPNVFCLGSSRACTLLLFTVIVMVDSFNMNVT